MNIRWKKALPTFFDIEASAEYSFTLNDLLGYRVTLFFQPKPKGCWALNISTGRNTYKQPFTLVSFNLSLGSSFSAK
jgi:hypothetical protein